jgi:3-dehydroquinate dehydratase
MEKILSSRSPARQKINVDDFVKPCTQRKPHIFGEFDYSKISLNRASSKSKLNISNETTQTKKRKEISGIIKSVKNEKQYI